MHSFLANLASDDLLTGKLEENWRFTPSPKSFLPPFRSPADSPPNPDFNFGLRPDPHTHASRAGYCDGWPTVEKFGDADVNHKLDQFGVERTGPPDCSPARDTRHGPAGAGRTRCGQRRGEAAGIRPVQQRRGVRPRRTLASRLGRLQREAYASGAGPK